MTDEFKKGYVRMKAIDFDTWNNAATVEANKPKNNLGFDNYSFAIPDINPSKVWGNVEHEFALKVSNVVMETEVLSQDEAISQGMVL